ncbi:MAG: hypothetical protein FWE61_10810 [Micrococcales bacterium]|nr:hypothetical protein [Micrococcales bacterium]
MTTPSAQPAPAAQPVLSLRAPGSLGRAAEAPALAAFLTDLETWSRERRDELDHLDPDSLDPEPWTPAELALRDDLVLAMGLWQAVRSRADDLHRTWDGGRVGPVEREQMTALVWGRLDTGTGAGTLSLLEAARLCDTLTASLRDRLNHDPDATDLLRRRRAVRAALVRCEDIAATLETTEPQATARVEDLVRRLGVVSTQSERGADVTGRLAELEVDTARAERDLIVAVAASQQLDRDRERAVRLRTALANAEPAVHDLAARTRAEIADPPRLAVPDVARLGDPPADRTGLEEYLRRLARVEQALARAREAFSAPLRQRAALRYSLRTASARSQTNGRAATATAQAAWDEASTAVETTPCDLPLAAALVEQYDLVTRTLPRSASSPDLPPP